MPDCQSFKLIWPRMFSQGLMAGRPSSLLQIRPRCCAPTPSLTPSPDSHRQAALGLGGPASTSTPRALGNPNFTSGARLCPTQEQRRRGAEALGSSCWARGQQPRGRMNKGPRPRALRPRILILKPGGPGQTRSFLGASVSASGKPWSGRPGTGLVWIHGPVTP